MEKERQREREVMDLKVGKCKRGGEKLGREREFELKGGKGEERKKKKLRIIVMPN